MLEYIKNINGLSKNQYVPYDIEDEFNIRNVSETCLGFVKKLYSYNNNREMLDMYEDEGTFTLINKDHDKLTVTQINDGVKVLLEYKYDRIELNVYEDRITRGDQSFYIGSLQYAMMTLIQNHLNRNFQGIVDFLNRKSLSFDGYLYATLFHGDLKEEPVCYSYSSGDGVYKGGYVSNFYDVVKSVMFAYSANQNKMWVFYISSQSEYDCDFVLATISDKINDYFDVTMEVFYVKDGKQTGDSYVKSFEADSDDVEELLSDFTRSYLSVDMKSYFKSYNQNRLQSFIRSFL